MKTLLILLISMSAYCGDYVVFNESTNEIISIKKSVPDYLYKNRTDVLEDPIIPNALMKYLKQSGGMIIEKGQAEKDAYDLAELTASRDNTRVLASAEVDDFNANGLRLRASMELVMQEINILRAIHSLSPRTLAQLKIAIKNKIGSGDVD